MATFYTGRQKQALQNAFQTAMQKARVTDQATLVQHLLGMILDDPSPGQLEEMDRWCAALDRNHEEALATVAQSIEDASRAIEDERKHLASLRAQLKASPEKV